MPRSTARRSIDLPVHIHEELAAEAREQGVPITQIAVRRLRLVPTMTERLEKVERDLQRLVEQRC